MSLIMTLYRVQRQYQNEDIFHIENKIFFFFILFFFVWGGGGGGGGGHTYSENYFPTRPGQTLRTNHLRIVSIRQ